MYYLVQLELPMASKTSYLSLYQLKPKKGFLKLSPVPFLLSVHDSYICKRLSDSHCHGTTTIWTKGKGCIIWTSQEEKKGWFWSGSMLIVFVKFKPLCPGVVALHCISARLPLQVPTNGKKETLEDSHSHTTPPVPHLRNDVHHPSICFRVIALHIA